MFRHTVFANDLIMIINKSKKEIETKIDDLYKEANECTKKKGKKIFVAIYYSGAGLQIYD